MNPQLLDWLLHALAPKVAGRAQLRVLYAQPGLPEVWLLTREGLEVHRDPEGGRFLVARGETIASLLLPQAELLFRPPL